MVLVLAGARGWACLCLCLCVRLHRCGLLGVVGCLFSGSGGGGIRVAQQLAGVADCTEQVLVRVEAVSAAVEIPEYSHRDVSRCGRLGHLVELLVRHGHDVGRVVEQVAFLRRQEVEKSDTRRLTANNVWRGRCSRLRLVRLRRSRGRRVLAV